MCLYVAVLHRFATDIQQTEPIFKLTQQLVDFHIWKLRFFGLIYFTCRARRTTHSLPGFTALCHSFVRVFALCWRLNRLEAVQLKAKTCGKYFTTANNIHFGGFFNVYCLFWLLLVFLSHFCEFFTFLLFSIFCIFFQFPHLLSHFYIRLRCFCPFLFFCSFRCSFPLFFIRFLFFPVFSSLFRSFCHFFSFFFAFAHDLFHSCLFLSFSVLLCPKSSF